MLNENMPSKLTQLLIYSAVLIIAYLAITNIFQGNVHHPKSFFIVIAGFILFLVAKASLILKGKPISFGSKQMTAAMANTYRIGYWLMCIGTIGTFFGPTT